MGEKTKMKSIIQSEKECYLCRFFYSFENTRNLEDHHIFFGIANRRLSEKYGLKVWLCKNHHNNGPEAVHNNSSNSLILKQIAQREFEKAHTREEFMKIFGENKL